MKYHTKGRKHKNCDVCKILPLFDLDEKIMIHGEFYTKEKILQGLDLLNLSNVRGK
jgi:hypothetical protein